MTPVDDCTCSEANPRVRTWSWTNAVIDLHVVVCSASIMLLAYHIITPISRKKTVSRTSDLWRQGLRLLAPATAASVDEDAAKFGNGGIFAEVYSSAAPLTGSRLGLTSAVPGCLDMEHDSIPILAIQPIVHRTASLCMS